MQQSRRVFLRALGAGAAFVSLPELSSIFNLFPSRSAADDGTEAVLRRLFFGEDVGGGPFVAHAETFLTESSPQQLLSAPSAFLNILEQLRVGKNLSPQVDYTEASQCRGNFETHHKTWREQFGEEALYTKIRRAPADRDVAILVGATVDAGRSLRRAEGATQYQQKPAVRLAGHDPGVIAVSPGVIGEHATLSDKEMARALAVVEQHDIAMEDGRRARRYETPVSSVVHIPLPRRNNRVGSRAVGVIAVSAKRDLGNVYFADLYA